MPPRKKPNYAEMYSFDEKTGLYYHGYDESRSVFWADPVTGLSRCFWLRAIGWFTLALADLTEILPEGAERQEIAGMLREVTGDLLPFADIVPVSALKADILLRIERSSAAVMAYSPSKNRCSFSCLPWRI